MPILFDVGQFALRVYRGEALRASVRLQVVEMLDPQGKPPTGPAGAPRSVRPQGPSGGPAPAKAPAARQETAAATPHGADGGNIGGGDEGAAPQETAENRKIAVRLVEKWSRPIFQTSDKVHATDLPVANAPKFGVKRGLASHDPNEVSGSLSKDEESATHARVPRPMGMDFMTLPSSSAAPLASSKYAKESVKGRLHDRINNGKKKLNPQAMSLSIEGRTLDRL